MDGVTIAAVVYLACFQACAWPGILRIRRRRSSSDLSVWREWILLAGVAVQLGVMLHDGASWRIWLSPVMSLTSVSILLWHIYRYRQVRHNKQDGVGCSPRRL